MYQFQEEACLKCENLNSKKTPKPKKTQPKISNLFSSWNYCKSSCLSGNAGASLWCVCFKLCLALDSPAGEVGPALTWTSLVPTPPSVAFSFPVGDLQLTCPAGLQLNTQPLAQGRFPSQDILYGQATCWALSSTSCCHRHQNLQGTDTCEASLTLSPCPPCLCPQMGTHKIFNYWNQAEYGEITHRRFWG